MDEPRGRAAVRRWLKDPSAVSPLVANVLKVAVIVVLVVLLYIMVTGIIQSPARVEVLDFTIAQDGANWSVAITAVPAGKPPAELFLLIRNATGDIVLPRTSFANLTADDWAQNRALYEDSNPTVPEVRAGDRLLIDRGTYPAGSRIEVSDKWSVLTMRTLR